MTISRGQMERQLRMGGGIMDVVPRDKALLGGIKKAVKKVGKTVKKIAKSDAGKLALAAAAAYYMPGGIKASGGLKSFLVGAPTNLTTGKAAFSGLFGTGGQFAPSVGKIATSLFGPTGLTKAASAVTGANKGSGFLTKGLALAGLSTFLTSQFGMSPEQAEETIANPESRAIYLKRYYENLNPNAAPEEVEEFVAANVAEYATGGRVGFADGPVLPPDPTQPVNPFGPKPGDFGIEEDIPIKMASDDTNERVLEALFEKYLDMGLSPKEAAEKAREEFERMGMRRIEETRGLAALGGRMGFDEGTKLDRGLMSLTDEAMDEAIDIPMEEGEKRLSILDKFDEDYGDNVVIITYDDLGRQQLKIVPKSKVMPGMGGGESLPIIAPRNNKAKGDTASKNAMQAAGIEGLPIRQNQAGVKELDLRNTGGFIQPVGIKEKADDIPAMLSNNEFVFTADAVRGMGDGNVNLGAQRMYDMMKKLEAGGRV